jgi:hypothetical protein
MLKHARAQHLAPIDCWSASRAIRCRSKVKTRIRRHCNLFLAFVAVLAFAFAAFATAGTALVFSNALVFCLRPRIQDSSQVNGGGSRNKTILVRPLALALHGNRLPRQGSVAAFQLLSCEREWH